MSDPKKEKRNKMVLVILIVLFISIIGFAISYQCEMRQLEKRYPALTQERG